MAVPHLEDSPNHPQEAEVVVITEGGPSHNESSLGFCQGTFSTGALKGKIWIKCMKRLSGGGFSSILEIHWKVEGSHYKHPRIWNNHWVSWEPLSKLIFTDIQANWCSLDSVVVNRSSVF